MNFISKLKFNYTNKRMDKIKQLYMSLNSEENAIKSDVSSPEIFVVNKKTSIKALPTMLSIGKNIEYNFESLKNNPINPKTVASADFIKKFENYAESMGINSLGYTKVPAKLIFKGNAILYDNAIVLTKEIDKKEVDNELSGKVVTDLKLYNKLGKITNELADYLRENGFGVHASHPAIGSVTYPTLAQYAGIGYRGKSNLLITPELGPRQKISAIFTSINNLPVKKENEHSWIADYCNNCGKCMKKCPTNAIVEIESFEGSKGSKFVPKLCRGCYESCTICMKECPFNMSEYTKIKKRFEKTQSNKK